MSATDELRKMLDERGVEWDYGITGAASTMFNANGVELTFIGMRDGVTCSTILSPAQAIAATVGRGMCRKVYLVETSDDLFEGWYPMAAYLHRESAEDCAEALRKKEGGIWQFARVSELKVVEE